MNIEALAELEKIIAELSNDDKKTISELDEAHLIRLHHGLGTVIRNKFRQNQCPALLKWSRGTYPNGKAHFDDLSMPVLLAIWKIVKAS